MKMCGREVSEGRGLGIGVLGDDGEVEYLAGRGFRLFGSICKVTPGGYVLFYHFRT